MTDPKSDLAGRRAVIAASIGNALEWYDFSVYAFFAVFIAQNFFVQSAPGARLLAAFMAFGLGFVIRPLGAVVLGSYADRAGRKAALSATIFTMAIGTAVLAFAPPYAAIGVGAPILIVAARMLQGFSAGGEIGGAAAFLIEHAPLQHKGMYASWLQASMAISNILAALMATVITMVLNHDQIVAWGWRIPFIFGLAIAPVGFWMRKTLDETPHFKSEQLHKTQAARASMSPVMEVVRNHPKPLILGFGMSILWAVSVYTLIIFMPTYVQTSFHFESRQAFVASLVGNCFMVVVCVYAGSLSDRLGRRTVLTIGTLTMLATVWPLLMWLKFSHLASTLIVVQSFFCIMVGVFTGVAPAALAELFHTRVRSIGMSLSYNIALTFFGGFAPAFLTWITRKSADSFAPAWYVMATCVITQLSILLMPKQRAGNS